MLPVLVVLTVTLVAAAQPPWPELPPAWTFRADWTFAADLQGIAVLPPLSCPYEAWSLLAYNDTVHHTLLTPPLLLRFFPCLPLPHNHSECLLRVFWHVQCIWPCDRFCSQPISLNHSHDWVCQPLYGFCQPQPKPQLLWPWLQTALAATATTLTADTFTPTDPWLLNVTLVGVSLLLAAVVSLGQYCCPFDGSPTPPPSPRGPPHGPRVVHNPCHHHH